MEEKEILKRLQFKFPVEVKSATTALGDEIVVIAKEALLPVATFLKEKPQDYAMLLDLTCVDHRGEEPRFEMVYHFLSLTHSRRLRIKARLAEKDPWIASLTTLWKNANWLEREVFDLFGVQFEGHPDLRRIFMYDGFEGYPLRKDYPLRRSQPIIPLKD